MFSDETKYYRELYKKDPNNKIFNDCCGETLALLDPKNNGFFPGTTKLFSSILLIFTVAMLTFGIILFANF